MNGLFQAEGVGFEPTMDCSIPVFKTGALGRSAIPPVNSPVVPYSRLYHKPESPAIDPGFSAHAILGIGWNFKMLP